MVTPEADKRPLVTIQKRNNLNIVLAIGESGTGGANHVYQIAKTEDDPEWPQAVVGNILFQQGPRNEEGSISGVLDADLLEIVRDRLWAFQKGEFATRENAIALTHIEEALLWMNKRVEDRAARGVLGTTNK